MGKEKEVDPDEGQNFREVQFFWVQAGKSYKEIFNLNCRCNMLLDAITKHSLPKIGKILVGRLEDIKVELASIAKQQADTLVREAEEAKAEAAAAEAAAEAAAAEAAEAEAKGAKKGAGKAKAPSKEDKDLEKKKLEQKQAYEQAKVALETTKNDLIEEEKVLFEQLTHIKKVKDIDLSKSDGSPLNLRKSGELYGSELLQGNGVYHILEVNFGEDGEIMQEPMELSV